MPMSIKIPLIVVFCLPQIMMHYCAKNKINQNTTPTTTIRSQSFCIFAINLVHDYYNFEVFFQLESCFHMEMLTPYAGAPYSTWKLIKCLQENRETRNFQINWITICLYGDVGGSPLGIWLDYCVNQNWKLEPPTLLLLLLFFFLSNGKEDWLPKLMSFYHQHRLNFDVSNKKVPNFQK